jgi:hypothetical protein
LWLTLQDCELKVAAVPKSTNSREQTSFERPVKTMSLFFPPTSAFFPLSVYPSIHIRRTPLCSLPMASCLSSQRSMIIICYILSVSTYCQTLVKPHHKILRTLPATKAVIAIQHAVSVRWSRVLLFMVLILVVQNAVTMAQVQRAAVQLPQSGMSPLQSTLPRGVPHLPLM